MGLFSVVGRLLLAAIFILAGVDKFQNPEQSTVYMTSRYEGVYNHVVKTYQIPLPDQLKPTFIKQVGGQIVLGVAGLEVLGGLLVILNVGFGASLLALFLVGTLVIIHNPLVHGKTRQEQLDETVQTLKNLAILGGLLLVGSKKSAPPTHQAKQTQPAKQTQQQQQQQQQPKGKPKRN